jgi:hypothetical protein
MFRGPFLQACGKAAEVKELRCFLTSRTMAIPFPSCSTSAAADAVFPDVTHHGDPISELLDQCRAAGKRGPCLRGKSPLCAAGQTML